MYFKSMVKKQIILLSTVMVGLTLQADSMLRIACDAQSSGATVTVNGKFKGECPLDGVKVSAGDTHIRVVKLIDPTQYWLFEQNINMGDDVVKRIEVIFDKTVLTELGIKEEKERVIVTAEAARKAQAQLLITQREEKLKAIAIAQKVQADKKAQEDLAIQEASRVWTDTQTNLMWQDNKEAKTAETNIDGAKRICANLNYGMFSVCNNGICAISQFGYAGYKNWRVPTKDELTDLQSAHKFKALKNVAHRFYVASDTGFFFDYGVVRFDLYGHFYEGGEGVDNVNRSAVRCVREIN